MMFASLLLGLALARPVAAAPVFDPAEVKPWLSAFSSVADCASKGCLKDSSWQALGVIDYRRPKRYAVLGPLARRLNHLPEEDRISLRRRMRLISRLSPSQRKAVANQLAEARLLAAPEVVRSVDRIMDKRVRKRRPLVTAGAARERIKEVEAVLPPLAHLTFYNPAELNARYNEAAIKLDSLKRALAKLEVDEAPRYGFNHVKRMGADRVLDAPADIPTRWKDPYVAARDLKGKLEKRGLKSPRLMVTNGTPARIVVSFNSPADRDRALDLFDIERDVSLSYRGVPVTVLLPSDRTAPAPPAPPPAPLAARGF